MTMLSFNIILVIKLRMFIIIILLHILNIPFKSKGYEIINFSLKNNNSIFSFPVLTS